MIFPCVVLHVLGLAARGAGLAAVLLLLLLPGSMDVLLKHRLRLVDLELGLEVLGVTGDTAAVGAAAGVDKVELFILGF